MSGEADASPLFSIKNAQHFNLTVHFNELFIALASFTFGLSIGSGFGWIQDNARRRHERRQQNGSINNGWINVPGSMQRVALLLGTLGLAQIFWPIAFAGSNKWYVSAGVAVGYGWMLICQFRQRRAAGV